MKYQWWKFRFWTRKNNFGKVGTGVVVALFLILAGWFVMDGVFTHSILAQSVNPSSQSQPVLGLRSSGAEVVTVQTVLKKKGIYRGKVDGIYGFRTYQAIAELQRQEGLTIDGIVGDFTWKSVLAETPQLDHLVSVPKQTSTSPATETEMVAQNPPIKSPVATATQSNTAAINSADGLIAPDLAKIQQRKQLIVAINKKDVTPFFQIDSPKTPCTDKHPFTMLDGKKFCGLDVERSLAIADALGVEVSFNRSADTFDGVVDLVYNHEADLALSKLSRTMPRALKVRFSEPYVKMRQGLLVNRVQLAALAQNKNPLEFIQHLTGKVGAIKGSAYVKWVAEKFPAAQAVEYETWDDVIQAALEGKVLAAYRDELEVKKLVLTRPNVALQFQTIALSDTNDSIAAAVAWDNPQLLAFVNQYLEDRTVQYKVDTLLEEYEDLLGKTET